MSRLNRILRFASPALIFLAATVAVLPQILHGPSCGHDFDFHLVSWFDCLNAWRHGILYPHWSPSANFMAGEPRFVFYPPLTWMLGAALGALLGWGWAPIVLAWLMLAASGLAVRALARLYLPDPWASLAGCFALVSGYSLFTAYERSAIGEMAGGFLIPLLLLLVLRDRRPAARLWPRALDGSAWLALILAASWLSNAPLGVMACYLLAAFSLAVGVERRTWVPVVRAAVAAPLGIGLAAIYILPAAIEQRWVEIRQAVDDPGLAIENSWLFARHPWLPALELHDIELARVSLVVVAMVGIALGSLAVLWLRRRRLSSANPAPILPLALIPAAVLLLQFPLSAPLWNLLPRLRFLQFPWRWLVVVEAPMGLFLALALRALWPKRRWLRADLAAAGLLFICAYTHSACVYFEQDCDNDDAVSGMVAAFHSGLGFEGVDEYAPPGADNQLLATNLPGACLTTDPLRSLGQGPEGVAPDWAADQGSCLATAEWQPGPPEYLRLATILPRPGFLVLRLRAYPAWALTLNGRRVQPAAARPDGLVVLAVPAGQIRLAAEWVASPATRAGRWLSALALVLLVCLVFLERRLSHSGLS